MSLRAVLVIAALLVPLAAPVAKEYNIASAFTDANAGGFVDSAPIMMSGTGKEDEDSDFIYEYAWVPYRHDMKPLFCTRKGIARAVTCFYVSTSEPRGGVLVETVIPKDS
jgi:hypothetical protein